MSGVSTPFVGRHQELEQAGRCFDEARSGLPRLVLISGDAGMGKTRLLSQLRTQLQRHSIVLSGRCYEETTVPYLPLVEALRSCLEQRPEGFEALGEVEADIIRRLMGTSRSGRNAERPSSPVVNEQLQLSLAVAKLLSAVADRGPLTLIVDDLHWADAASLELLSHLIFAIADTALRRPLPVLIICTYRPVQADDRARKAIARFEREEISCETLELAGLSEREIDGLVRGFGFPRPSHQLILTLARATSGNPLFIQEAMADLSRRGAIGEKGGYLVATVPAADLKVPEQVTDAIAIRLRSLSDQQRQILSVAAALGDRFDLNALVAVIDSNEESLLSVLDDLTEQRLLEPEGGSFRFAHPLIRHVLYSSLSGPRRERLHQQAAKALEKLYAHNIDQHATEIAHHLQSAGRLAEIVKVVEYSRRVGDDAFGLYAWAEAARHYAAALAAAQTAGGYSAHELAELHHLAGFAYYRDLDPGPGLYHLEKAAEGFKASGDIPGLATALFNLTRHRLTQSAGAYGVAVDVQPLEDALVALGDSEPEVRGRTLASISQASWAARQTERAENAARQALELGQQIGNDRVCVEACSALALSLAQKMEVGEALAVWQKGLEFARRHGDPWEIGWSLARIPLALMWLGRLDEAETAAREGLEVMRVSGDWAEHSLTTATMASVALAKGDLGAIQGWAMEAKAAMERSSYPWAATSFLPALACARFLRGHESEAHDALDPLIEPGRVFDEVTATGRGIVWLYRQLVRAHANEREEVKQQLERHGRGVRALPKSDIFFLGTFCALVEIGSLTGDDDVVKEASEAVAYGAAKGVRFTSGWVFLIPRLLGVAATIGRDWERAEESFQTAIQVAAKNGARPELGRTFLDYAGMMIARGGKGDRDRATDLVQRALPIFVELGIEPFRRRATELADSLRVEIAPQRARVSAYPDRLSEREVEVLLLIARGRSYQQIADELILSPKTVARHVSNIFDKTGVENRSAATAYAFERGLVKGAESVREPAVATPAAITAPTRVEQALAQRLLVILFTDMEGSTALTQRLGDAAAQEVLRSHDRKLMECIQKHSGTKIKHTGDGVMASFAAASSAIQCAVEIQRAFSGAREGQPDEGVRVRIRIGLNAGEPVAEEGDLFGSAVQAAARIAAKARAGEILVSDVVRQLAAGKRFEFSDRGRVALRGFQERFRLHSVRWEA